MTFRDRALPGRSWAGWFGFIAWSTIAAATSFIQRPFPETVKEAPIIVRGRVGASYVDWSKAGVTGKSLFTFTELRVEETLKGSTEGPSLTLREMGGEKDGVGMQVSGSARFSPGEDVVVFLSSTEDRGVYQVRGMMMGRLEVERAADGSEVLRGPAIDLHGDDDGHVHQARGDRAATPERWTMDRLRALIREQAPSAPVDARGESANPSESLRFNQPVSSGPSGQAPSAAPALQSALKDPEPALRRSWIWGLGLLGVAGVIWVFWRRRKS